MQRAFVVEMLVNAFRRRVADNDAVEMGETAVHVLQGLGVLQNVEDEVVELELPRTKCVVCKTPLDRQGYCKKCDVNR